jgi:hypothetical protein
MITGMSEFCNIAPPEACAACTASHGSEVKGLDPYGWRRNFLAFLEGASQLTVPSADLGAFCRPGLPIRERPCQPSQLSSPRLPRCISVARCFFPSPSRCF